MFRFLIRLLLLGFQASSLNIVQHSLRGRGSLALETPYTGLGVTQTSTWRGPGSISSPTHSFFCVHFHIVVYSRESLSMLKHSPRHSPRSVNQLFQPISTTVAYLYPRFFNLLFLILSLSCLPSLYRQSARFPPFILFFKISLFKFLSFRWHKKNFSSHFPSTLTDIFVRNDNKRWREIVVFSISTKNFSQINEWP